MNRIIVLAICLSLTIMSKAEKNSQQLLNSRVNQADSLQVIAMHAIAEQYKFLKPDTAILYAKRGLILAKRNRNSHSEGLLNRLLGEIDLKQGNVVQAKFRFQRALHLFETTGDQNGIASIYNDLGLLAGRQGNYKKATPFIVQALKSFERLRDTSGIIQSYIKLGSINLETEKLDKALLYFDKGLALTKSYSKSNTLASLLNNIGQVFLKNKDYPKALAYFDKGMMNLGDSTRIDVHIELLNNASNVYRKIGNRDHALSYARQALFIARRVKFPEQEASTLVTVSSLLQETRPDSSKLLLQQALKISRAIHQPFLRLNIYQGLVDLYKETGHYKEAERVLEVRGKLKDSLFNVKQAKEIADLQSSYELAKSVDKVQELNNTNQMINYYKNIILAVAIVVFIFLIFMLFLYRKTRKLNKKLIYQKNKLRQQKVELDKENKFKDKLFSIIGHDLRSPIATLVDLMKVAKEDDLSIEEFQSIIPQLMAQSQVTLETLDKLLIWGKSKIKGMISNKTQFNAKELVEKNIALYQNAASQKMITLSDNTPAEVWLVADSAQIDFIIRNLLANAIKYTNNGGQIEINASLNEVNGFNAISVNDNGVGIDVKSQHHIFERSNISKDGTAQEKGTSIGLMLCKEFIRENCGKIDLQSELGKGTKFTVSIPCL